MKDNHFVEMLLGGSSHVGVWGIGTIGFSSMVYFAEKGIAVLGYDKDLSRVEAVKRGDIPVPGMESWLTQNLDALVVSGRLKSTFSKAEVLASCLIHLIAVPTEKDGEPHSYIVEEVLADIVGHVSAHRNSPAPCLIVIESTLTPGVCRERLVPIIERTGLILGEDIYLAVSPRRDWFKDGGYFLRGLDRVFGGCTDACADAAQEVLALVCDKLHRASSGAVAEITKVVENAYRFVEISLANQLALAYPEIDMVEVLELASTKWNMGHYVPSLGAGGHCIPVAPHHLLKGTPDPREISIVSSAVQDRLRVVDSTLRFLRDESVSRVLVLGISYRANVKMSIFSAAIPLIRGLLLDRCEVGTADPYYADSEIEAISGGKAIRSDAIVAPYDAIILTVDHTEFCEPAFVERLLTTANPRLVIDNTGRWKSISKCHSSRYLRIGSGDMQTRVPQHLGHSQKDAA